MKGKAHWIVAFSFIMMYSCYNPEEACLDTLASNYTVTADRNCNDCCTYPELSIVMKHLTQDSNFNSSDTLINVFGQQYSILDVRFYLSEFLLRQQGQELKVLETITPESENTNITDDVMIWRSVDGKSAIGSIKAFGKFEGLAFRLGIDASLLSRSFENLNSGHPLSKEGKLRDSEGLPAWFYIKYVHYKPEPETVTIYLNESIQRPTYILDSLVQTSKGSPITYIVKANYGSLLKQTNLNGTLEDVKNGILGNLNDIIVVD